MEDNTTAKGAKADPPPQRAAEIANAALGGDTSVGWYTSPAAAAEDIQRIARTVLTANLIEEDKSPNKVKQFIEDLMNDAVSMMPLFGTHSYVQGSRDALVSALLIAKATTDMPTGALLERFDGGIRASMTAHWENLTWRQKKGFSGWLPVSYAAQTTVVFVNKFHEMGDGPTWQVYELAMSTAVSIAVNMIVGVKDERD